MNGPSVRGWREMPEARIGDRFELVAEIGCGGMGTVYRALDSTTGGVVALKVILPGSAGDAARFARECEILAALSHPSIVRYVAHGETSDGEPWLAMEWLDGESLSRRVQRGALPWREAARIGRDVAAALAVAHASGVIHRDLKPGNLFLSESGVKVLDFGVARFRGRADGLTKTGQIIGTPGYMAPEQARSEKELTAAADLFSLGCVLYHLVTGEPPFDGDDVLSVLARLVLEEPHRLASVAEGVPAALDALVHRMLAKSRDRRPASAAEVRDALDAILRGDLSPPPPRANRRAESDTLKAGVRRSVPAPTWSERRRSVRIAATAVVAAGAIAGAAYTAWSLAVADDPAPVEAAIDAPPRADPSAGELRQACQAWATALAHAQRPDGSFGIEPHRQGWGWTTGQELLALARAHGTCGTPGEETLRRGAAALERLRVEHGWGGAETRASSPAVAWAALAFAAVAEELDDDALRTRAREARDLLLGAQHEGGAFPFWMDGADDELSPYSTVLALWALFDVAPLGEDARAARARARASRWLRAALAGDTSGAAIRETAGMDEQATWTLLRVGEGVERALLTSSAERIVARCRPSASGECERPLHENGEAYLDRQPGHGPNLVTLWRPWATLASARLAVTQLPHERRTALRAIAAWGTSSMTRDVESMTIAPSYQLAEYLFVLTELAGR